MRIGLVIEYEGTELFGSQLQANGRTVQGELEKALAALFHSKIRPRMASRTDSGVHARGQVAAFDVDTRLGMMTVRDALNHYLPEDIGIRHAAVVPDGFDPRRHAVWREYEYTINDGPVAPRLNRHFAAWVRGPLDDRAMDVGARELVGVHDFASFSGGATPDEASTVRRIDAAGVMRQGEHVQITFRANAFLNQQARRMAGVLIEIGLAGLATEDLKKLVDRPVRGSTKTVAPPHGLCLTRIEYRDAGPTGLPAVAEA
ncbi:MAG: tRNA pseudouridine(38-40) synthase TruA [Chloroflexi bacterium]|nr:tRNA pseudouridine(38-40) synthase TruA [Chloroflexota bacterium]